MKTILYSLSVFIICIKSAFALSPLPPEPTAPKIPLGPQMVVWAISQACEGTLEVTGEGLKKGSPTQIFVLKDEKTLEGMLSHFNVDNIKLSFSNPQRYVLTKGQILDSEGQPLFIASHHWTLEREVGKLGQISYTVPEWAGNLWFELQDIEVPFDGERATAILNDGSTMSLRVSEEKLLLPSNLSWSQGVLEVRKNGFIFQYDIQSGTKISSNREMATSTQASGVGNIQQVQTRNMLTKVYTYPHNAQLFETVPDGKGFLTVKTISDGWVTYGSDGSEGITYRDNGKSDTAVSERPVADGDVVVIDPLNPDYYWYDMPAGIRFHDGTSWKYIKNDGTGIFKIPVSGMKSVYFFFEWNVSSGKG